LSVPILAGRDTSDSDTAVSQPVAVVSESFGRRHWPGANPIGRHFWLANTDRTIVGVVGNIRVRGLERSSEPQVYLPYQQHGDNVSLWYAPKDLVVQVAGSDDALIPAIRQRIAGVDPGQPISDVRSLGDIVAGETATRSVQLRVLAGFAAIAALLAAFGIHGLLSFAVSTQTREIGIRVALGAQRRDVVGFVVRRAVVLSAIGILAGATLAGIAGRHLQSALAGLNAGDLPTFAVGIGLVLSMAMLGSLGAAIQAVRIDPKVAMQQE
jgi:hypothetical protein